MICGLTSEEHKPINSDLLVPRNAKLIDELFLRTKRHERSKEPTIAILALMDILGASSIDEELRFLKDVLDALHPGREVDILCEKDVRKTVFITVDVIRYLVDLLTASGL
jgi:hypothetical protein